MFGCADNVLTISASEAYAAAMDSERGLLEARVVNVMDVVGNATRMSNTTGTLYLYSRIPNNVWCLSQLKFIFEEPPL